MSADIRKPLFVLPWRKKEMEGAKNPVPVHIDAAGGLFIDADALQNSEDFQQCLVDMSDDSNDEATRRGATPPGKLHNR